MVDITIVNGDYFMVYDLKVSGCPPGNIMRRKLLNCLPHTTDVEDDGRVFFNLRIANSQGIMGKQETMIVGILGYVGR